jgi:hypothetical protein
MPRPRKGLPVLHRSSSCMHAVAITPVESQSASFALFLCNISLPRNHGGSASTSRLSRPAQRSLTLRPAYSPSHFHDPLHRRLQPFRYLHNCSDCYRLERKLPGGICTRWKTVPLHGAHDKGRYQAVSLRFRASYVRIKRRLGNLECHANLAYPARLLVIEFNGKVPLLCGQFFGAAPFPPPCPRRSVL